MTFNQIMKKTCPPLFFGTVIIGLITVSSTWSSALDFQEECKSITVNKLFESHKDYTRQSVQEKIIYYKNKSYTQAGVMAGAFFTQDFFKNKLTIRNRKERPRFGQPYRSESGTELTSFQSYLEGKGCQLETILMDGSDQGIDHVFFPTDTRSRKVNMRYPPLFVEAQYRDSCDLPKKIIWTQYSSQQLSSQWLTDHIDGIKEHLNIKFPSGTKISVIIPNESQTSRDDLDQILSWFNESIVNKNMYRYLSLLCPNGNFGVYEIQEFQ